MQYPIADLSLAGPLGAGPAGVYGKVIRDTERPREFELRIFEQITAALEAANQSGTHFTVRIAAMHRNRELWLTLTADLMNEDNKLPKSLRASLISLGIWVTNETLRAMQNTTSLAALIEVNRSIIRGLATASAGAS
ncbi:MAG: flagellar biosynthesis regulator FlaF [Acetobacteraceae bacterium]|jgi:flagellar biosynthesis regulator FlaF